MSLQRGVLTSASPSGKPIILCLHGGGTNSTIFNIQTIRLQRSLASIFDFVFLDGPFEALPGPGVLPTFEGCGPFYRWMRLRDDSIPKETRRAVDRVIRGPEAEGKVVGVLGFSQGAKLAAGLLLEQQLHGADSGAGHWEGFKFGVFLNGTSPPLAPEGFSDEDKNALIAIPSLHVVGLKDPWMVESRMLFDHFDKTKAVKLEFDVEHRLPTVEAETAKIVGEILRLYKDTCGHAWVDLNMVAA